MIYRFEDCEFDSDAFVLTRDGVTVDATPQVLAILQLLLARPGQLVTKDDLVDEVWDGRAVTDTAITVRIRALREALGDNGTDQRILKTVRGKGVRFVPEVEYRSKAIVRTPDVTGSDDTAPARPPSVAVQPFRLVGVAGPYANLAEALPDEIITALSRMHSLFVISRGSSFRFPSFDVTPATVGEELGVDYCASGEMEISGNMLTLQLELADTKSEEVVWRERFETQLGGVHELREDIVARVAHEMDHQIARHELLRARIQVPSSLSAWQSFYSGMTRIFWYRRPDYAGSEAFFTNAIKADPNFARAHAGLATMHFSSFFHTWDSGFMRRMGEMHAAADNGYALDPLDPFCVLASARSDMSQLRGESAIEKLHRAIELGPNDYQAYGDLARIQALAGDVIGAERNLSFVDALHPLEDSPLQPLVTRTNVALCREDAAAAVGYADRLQALPAQSLYSSIASLNAYHFAGDYDRGRTVAEACKQQFPGISGSRIMMVGWLKLDPGLKALFTDAFTAYDML